MAKAVLIDDNGARSDPNVGEQPTAPQFPGTSPTTSGDGFDAAAEVNKIFAGSGIAPGESDIANLAAKNPADRAQFLSDLTAQRDRRASSNGGGSNGGSSLTGASTAPQFANTSPQFTDPTQRRIEDYALDQFNRLLNPDANSGQAQLEAYLKQLTDTLKQPVYSPQDESIIKGQMVDSIEQERADTKRQWLEEISRRGIPPSSGVALQGIQHIDDQFNRARTTIDAQFAQQAIGQTRQQRLQVADVLSQLAGTENTRLANAGTYAMLPYSLQQDAFSRNLQLVGAGGNPAQTLSSALALLQNQQYQSQLSAQNRADAAEAIAEYIARAMGF